MKKVEAIKSTLKGFIIEEAKLLLPSTGSHCLEIITEERKKESLSDCLTEEDTPLPLKYIY